MRLALRLIVAFLALAGAPAFATTYYVNNNGGSDSNNGTSQSTPFATIYPKAAHTVVAGDTVLVNAGNGPYAGGIFLGTSGTSGNLITYTGTTTSWGTVAAWATNGPQIFAASGQTGGVQINGDYIVWQGFNVQGITTNSVTSANGIVFGQLNTNCSTVYHHVTIQNNTVASFPGGGIATVCADYVAITNNLVHGNANNSVFGNSGISIYASQNFDAGTGVKSSVTGNTVFNNVELVIETACGAICDGNGIIIDDNSNSQTNSVQYTGRTLVENNVVYSNGGDGILLGNSSHVGVYYNTTYANVTTGVRTGEIAVSHSAGDVDIENNIINSLPSGTTEFAITNTTGLGAITWNFNILFNGTSAVAGVNDKTANPQFVTPPSNFVLQPNSPAIAAANQSITVATDIQGDPRPTNGSYDDGAYQTLAAPTWNYGTISLASMTHGYMAYQYAEVNYPGTVNKSPLLIFEHANSEGDNCYAAGGGSSNCNYVPNNEMQWVTSAWMATYCPPSTGCVILVPYADQTSDSSGQTSNFGGYGDSPGTMNNELGVVALINQFETSLNIDPTRVLCTGESLGAIGCDALALDYGIGTGSVGHLVSGIMSMSGAITRSSTATGAPSIAAAVGYTTNTFGTTAFTSATVDITKSYTSGFQWYPFNFFGETPTTANVTLNADGSLTAGEGPNTFSAAVASAAACTTSGLPGYIGTAFGGGAYIQATVKFNPTAFPGPGGWPAFWSVGIEGALGTSQWPGQVAGYDHYIEPDIMEYFEGQFSAPLNQFSATTHDWYGVGGSSNYQVSTPFTVPQANFASYNTAAMLWVPATATTAGYVNYYWNGAQVSHTSYTQLTAADLPPPSASTPWSFGIIDQDHLMLIAGSNNTFPITVSNVQVWQANGVNNLPPSSPAVNCANCPTNAQVAQVQGGPFTLAINGSSDNQSSNPVLWNNPLWQDIAGNTNYPGPPTGGVAGSSPYHYLLDTTLGHDTWDTYYPLPTGAPLWNALFNVTGSSGGGGVPPPPPPPPSPGSVLSAGYFHVLGNQFIDGGGNSVRLSCSGYNQPLNAGTGPQSYSNDMAIMRAQGFNCARVPWFDHVSCPGGACSFTTSDAVVAAATANSMRVIFDHQSNEGVDGTNACTTRQANGLWYDLNSTAPYTITNGTDGCGTTGTVTYAQFKANWTAFATHYAGNATVIGFDLHNEPTTFGNAACCSTGTAITNFSVSGGKIITPAGTQFNGRGIALYDSDIPSMITNAAAQPLTTLFPKVNFLRLSMGLNGAVCTSPYNWNLDLPANFTNQIAWATGAGIVVIIENLAFPQTCSVQTGAQLTAEVGWYAAWAAAYKNNPLVWFETPNEPLWNGEQGSQATVTAEQVAIYNGIRGAGNNSIVTLEEVAGGPTYVLGTNCSSGACLGPASAYQAMTNVIWDMHTYAYTVNGQTNLVPVSTIVSTIQSNIALAQQFTSRDGVVPVISGEYGESTDGVNQDVSGQNTVTAVEQVGNPTQAFVFNAAPSPNNLGSISGGVESPFGTTVAAYIAAGTGAIAPPGTGSTAIGANWATGNGGDELAMANDVGAAVEAADPGALIFVEGVINNGNLFNGTTYGSTAYPVTAGSNADLSTVQTTPVTCCSAEVAYSVHTFPTSISSLAPDTGPSAVTMYNAAWGKVEVQNFAPVWIGEMGASLDNSDGNLTDQTSWATTLTQYANGQLGGQGGPTFTACQRPMDTTWWTYGYLPGQQPNGTLNADNSSKSGQQNYWSSLLYSPCATPPPPPPPPPGTVQAQRLGDFINMISVQACLTGGGAAPCTANNGTSMLADLQYLGIHHLRSGFDITLAGGSPDLLALTTLLNNGISFIAGPPYPSSPTAPSLLTTTTPANQISQAHSWQAINANAIFMLDGINEPGEFFPTVVYGTNGVTASNCTGSGGAGGDGCTWVPNVQYERDYIAALLADPALSTLPILTLSRGGGEPTNVGAQFATIQGGSSSLPAGTVLGQIINNHVYPTDDGQYFYTVPGTNPAYPINTNAIGACQPNDPTAGNAFNIQTHFDNVVTFNADIPGYATDAAAQALPRAVTEFGYPSFGITPGGDSVTEDKKGRCIMNGLLTGWQMGMKAISIFGMYSGFVNKADSFGLMSGNAVPQTSGTYVHNLLTILADPGATARSFTPGSLAYTLTGLTPSMSSQLFERADGVYFLAIWDNATDWNLAAGTPITVGPNNVTFSLGNGQVAALQTYDAVTGISALQSLSANQVTVPVSDEPAVIQIGGVVTQAGQTTWNPADLSGLTLSNNNFTATSSGVHQSVRSTTSQVSPAKVCFEITASTITNNWDVGLANSTFNLVSLLGDDGNGIGLDPNAVQGTYFNNAALSNGTGTSPNGEKETMCADLSANRFWSTNATQRGNGFPWNNSATANPATGVGGLSFAGMACPCYITWNEDEATGIAVLNATGPFTITTPAGFSPWQAPVPTSGGGRAFILFGD